MDKNMNDEFRYRFGNICERDIDTLLLGSFAMDTSFLDLFIQKLNDSFPNPSLVDIELSKTDPLLGESDVTVRFDSDGKRVGLLIEDKINAIAQPEQHERYTLRGKNGIEHGDYDEFFIFICAPKKYLACNNETKLYEHSMAFEELRDYFSNKESGLFGRIRYELIEQALNESETPYTKVVDARATQFWRDYIAYVRETHPDLRLFATTTEKSGKGSWMEYATRLNISKVKIVHKYDRGIIDLTFGGMDAKHAKLSRFLEEQIGDYQEDGLSLQSAGKSAVLRIDLGPNDTLDYQKPFGEQIESTRRHVEAVQQLHDLAARLDRETLVRLMRD